MPESVAHHFVPQHLQKNFFDTATSVLSVFDVTNARTFPTGSAVLMQRGGFHTLVTANCSVNFEDDVTAIENQVLATLNDVVEHQRLTQTKNETRNLAKFLAFQELRTSRFRNNIVRLQDELQHHANRLGFDISEVANAEPFEENQIVRTHLRAMFENVEGFARILAPRVFLLLSPLQGRHLYLGDSPVVRHNDEQEGFHSNLGFASAGLQIYTPLSKDLMLGVWDRDLLQSSQDQMAEAQRVRARYTLSPDAQANVASTPDGLEMKKFHLELTRSNEERLRCIEEGRPVELQDDNVDFYNSLQLSAAERHVVCPNSDFDLANRWFADSN
ncbi:MAG: DUF4238 domain-containing protein [Gallionellaceae bacterium]